MTTYNTGNPVPSADARDRFDNSQTLDEAVNGTLTFYQNRVGNNVLSLKGMADLFQTDQSQRENDFNFFIQNSGYETPVPYAGGINIQRFTQLLEYNGELYRAKTEAVPFITTGSWITDSQNLISVGDAALRQDLASPDFGTKIIMHKANPVGVNRSLFDHLSDNPVSVKAYGAIGDGVSDCSAAIAEAVSVLKSNPFGGIVFYPPGDWAISSECELATNVKHVGAGKSLTTVTIIPGSNSDAFVTTDFDDLSASGNISQAPYGFAVEGITIQGNYLDLSGGKTWRTSDAIINSSGSGVKIYGSRYYLDIEVYNIADNALRSEGGGSFYENQEHASIIKLTGRTSGQEGIVFRGPGDINMQYVIFGICGTLPRTERLTSTGRDSKLYPGMKCVGLMLDNKAPYTGHAELGLVHIYAVSYNYAVYTKGTNRFNARHVVGENSLGGFYFGDGAHGIASIVEARANGRMPDAYTGTEITQLKDVDLDNGSIWNLNLTIKSYRYRPSRNFDGYLVDISGSNNNVRCAIFSQLQPDLLPLKGNGLRVAGDNNVVSFTMQRIRGVGCYVGGTGNNVTGSIKALYEGTALVRDTGFGNHINVTALSLAADSIGFNSIGTVAAENITLTVSGSPGFTPFVGDPMAALNRACTWTISAVNANTINGKSTDDYIEANIPTTELTGTLIIPHNFLYAPNRTQVSLSLNFPGTPPNQLVQFGVVGVPTATDVTVAYRWAALPTSGGANLNVHIK